MVSLLLRSSLAKAPQSGWLRPTCETRLSRHHGGAQIQFSRANGGHGCAEYYQ